ncbi:MAG: outer membrane beta-barrel protein [Desulfobacterales bacterium]|nr:outer membrane beta-barrel protein [Pseudomonadota bacterium]MBU4354373.1 outer membrane beta-barrel protein [Pseudomonadota bacterium]MCG2771368.1 outer membrane beta-barrel protein [Desulfobacterales bacterium]
MPKFVPGVTPFAPYAPYNLTFGPGPSTGMLAPYGYGGAEDTLIRGWQSHKLGPFRVSPYFEYDTLYRTNVFQTYSNKKSDFVNMINPGIRFELPVAGTHKLSLGYLGNYFIYSRFSDNSHYDQNVNADAALNFSKLSLRVGAAYRNATEEASLLQVGPIFTLSGKRVYNRVTPYFQATYKMADLWRIETNYQFDSLSFAKSIYRVDNYQANTFGGTIFYKFWPKTAALVQFIADIRTHPFDSTRDNVVYTPMAGLTWDPTAKLSGTLKVGYSITNYSDRNAETRGFNPDGVALSIQTLYKLSRFTQMSLVAQRSLQEDVDSANAGYFNTGLLFTLSHFWHYFKVTSYASFSYYNNHYIFNQFDPGTGELKKRDDNIIYAGAGLSRPVTRWLKLRFDYLYYNRGSNFSFYPTNEHKVLLGVQSSF